MSCGEFRFRELLFRLLRASGFQEIRFKGFPLGLQGLVKLWGFRANGDHEARVSGWCVFLRSCAFSGWG